MDFHSGEDATDKCICLSRGYFVIVDFTSTFPYVCVFLCRCMCLYLYSCLPLRSDHKGLFSTYPCPYSVSWLAMIAFSDLVCS